MGYYAHGGGNLMIKKENFGRVVEAYHSWMAEMGVNASDMKDIKAVFEDQWFEVDFDDDGNLRYAWFNYEKYRDADEFIEILAPWTENGSYLDFIGEDDAMWRLSVYNHEYYETSGVVIFPGDPYEKEE